MNTSETCGNKAICMVSSMHNCHSELGEAQGTIRDLPSDFYYANICAKKLPT